jgi:hypothetical protein
MADDGKRELEQTQFETLDGKLGGIDGAINRLAENVSDPDTSVAAEVALFRNEVGMRLTALNESAAMVGQAVNSLSENLGKWLAAIALASATPEDNSAEVKELAGRIKNQVDALDASAKQQQIT